MSLSVGTDIIEIQRIEQAIVRHGKRFQDRLFTALEQEYCDKHEFSSRNYAGRFAAKEAIAKALGTGFGKELSFADIEIYNDDSGKPVVSIQGERREDITLSISHCKDYAVATAIIF